MSLPREIFRASDIRGIVDRTLTAEIVRDIGRAIGTQILETGSKTIVVGRDGRLSGPVLEKALIEGIIDTGCDVIKIGIVPTPVLYFATIYLKIPSGVILTGSHNPANYNGLKIMIDGKTLFEEGIQQIYQRVEAGDFKKGQGGVRLESVNEAYIETIKNTVHLGRNLKIVVDAGNGVTGSIAPPLYQALGCDVIPLFCDLDGRFPNHHPDPGQPKNLIALQQAVIQEKADLGLAFDGDGDRLGVIDNLGNIIWPDRTLILFAEDVLSRNPNADIIYDVKCSRLLASAVKKAGGNPLMWKTGHALIKSKMLETGALLAGEMSGHFFFKERWYGFDDGLYSGARLLEILSKRNSSSSAVFKNIPDSINTPELQLPISENIKFEKMKELIDCAKFENARISTIDGLRVDFLDGFGLVRPSNTSPNLILRFEGDSQEILDRIQLVFRTLLLKVEPNWQLPF